MTPGIRYIRSDAPAVAADYLSGAIKHRLESGQDVIWFLSGGSAIEVAVLTAARISPADHGLTVTLADERFVPEGHPDSNLSQLLGAGFKLPGADLIPVLRGDDETASATEFDNLAGRLFKLPAYKIALLGIGADGHTAGILPGSEAAVSGRLTCSYKGPDYRRLTLTARALSLLDEAVIYAQGEAKRSALNGLTKTRTVDRQPAQVLKKVPIVTIFSGLEGVWNENRG